MRITRLLTTAIKGLALEEPTEIVLDASGAVGDRDFFCVDERGGLVSITATGAWVGLRAAYDAGREHLTLTDSATGQTWEGPVVLGEQVPVTHYGLDVPGRRVAGPWDEVLSERGKGAIRLLRATGPRGGSDVHPVTLLGDTSVQAVADSAGAPALDARRFRMLLGFDGAEPFAEDDWKGREVTVGEATLLIGGPVPRCVATTRDPDSGSTDVPVVKAIVDLRGVQENELGQGANLGVYATVVTGGRVRIGDTLQVR